MAQPPQQGPSTVSLFMQPSNSVSGGSTASNGGSPSMPPTHSGRSPNNWDGDRMLHVYMIDYCRKRGYNQVVNALCAQTAQPPDVKAPIDAPQGLLFEWWVVFWEIFTAKSEDDPKKNAVAYLHDQRAKNYRPMHQPDVKPPIGVQMQGHTFNGPHPPPPSAGMMGPGFQGHPAGHPTQQPPGMQPMPTPNGVLPPGQQHPPQPSGAPTPVPPSSQHVNGPQPYPPQSQTQQPPHPNAANGPQGHPPNQTPGAPQPMVMGNRPGGPGGPQMGMGAQRGLGSGMQNGQVTHQQFAGSPLGPGGGPANGGPHPSPRTSQMGPPRNHPQQQGPANAPTPGGSGMGNGVAPNLTPLMAAQQFMTSGRPNSRSGTPGSQVGGANQPGVGMSPSRAGAPPMQPGPLVRPGSQMGGPQQAGGQGSPFTSTMPGPPGAHITNNPPQLMDQTIRNLGYGNRTYDSLAPEERNNVQNALRSTVQGQRQPGMGTPRLAPGGNPSIPGPSQPGPPGPQGGMPGPNFPQQQQFQPQQMMGQPGQQIMKRPVSPSMNSLQQMGNSANESSGHDAKRMRMEFQNGSAPNSSFAPGVPGANGMAGQHNMPNGVGNPNVMRPLQGGPANPGQQMNMMVNGGSHGPGGNPMHQRGPQQPSQQRFANSGVQNKSSGLVANPNASGLPIPKTEPGTMDLQQQMGNLSARGPQPKVHPSPSISHAKASSSMPPPSQTPNPSQAANKAGIKEEALDASAKSSPGGKTTQNPPTPNPNAVTPANAQNPNLNAAIFSSAIVPSAVLANLNQSVPPPNASRPGSSVNPQPATAPSAGSWGSEMYTADFGLLEQYGLTNPLPRPDDLTTLDESNFDFMSEFLNPSAVALQDDDITAATAGGSS